MKALAITTIHFLLFTFNSYGQANWVYSGAPIGDESTYSYPMSSSSILTLQHPLSQDSLRVYATTGNPEGVHIYRVDQAPNVICGSPNIGNNDRYFGIFVVNGTSPTYTAKYYYDGNPYVTPVIEPNLELAERPTNADVTCPSWSAMGASLNMVSDELTVSGLSGRKEIILTTKTTPLPVELIAFDAACDGDKAILEWVTKSEVNNDYFTVERSYDGETFVEVGIINGAGNSNKTNVYNFVDENNAVQKTYYRLKQTDFNGNYTYYEWKEINCVSVSFNVYPNPAKNKISLNLTEVYNKINVSVFNGMGQKVMERILLPVNGIVEEDITVNHFAKGLYYMKIENTYFQKTLKLIVE